MAVVDRARRQRFRRRAVDQDAGPDNRLSYTDQAMFLALRATGEESLAQFVWVYDNGIDLDAVHRFHADLGYGLFGRLIEPSPLPFGRHRWVAATGPVTPFDIEQNPRPRTELTDWADERAGLPIDPETGPGWRMGALPMTDGSTAVSLEISHCLTDGMGAVITITDALKGIRRDLNLPPAGARPTWRGVREDARDTVREVPALARTLVAAARLAYRRRGDIKRSAPPPIVTSAGDSAAEVQVPAISVFVNAADWDSSAEALGGNYFSLAAGFAARLGARMGRQRAADGAVSLLVPISERTEDDSRANAVSLDTIAVDPASVTTDLTAARTALREGFKRRREEPDESLELLPLIPFVPKFTVKRGADVLFDFADLPVSCTNLGDLDPILSRLDGTDCDYLLLRGINGRIPRRLLEQRRGLLTVVSSRFCGRVSLTVVGYQPGAENTKDSLRAVVSSVLAEFGLADVDHPEGEIGG
ncbi:hypothetical protein [Mycobacterium sp. ACS4331]|uniref:hypothetical protein n=1 Tax=Mycobacterium sp. ACS4331 TaxID=1834121 RepID=UPI00080087F0|nr:hypothetical protein [Mycobacterium sp. ACS4331]OBF11668.1 hypothetical protein A5727_19355 [Mycobacterium sp. ACS4331]